MDIPWPSTTSIGSGVHPLQPRNTNVRVGGSSWCQMDLRLFHCRQTKGSTTMATLFFIEACWRIMSVISGGNIPRHALLLPSPCCKLTLFGELLLAELGKIRWRSLADVEENIDWPLKTKSGLKKPTRADVLLLLYAYSSKLCHERACPLFSWHSLFLSTLLSQKR